MKLIKPENVPVISFHKKTFYYKNTVSENMIDLRRDNPDAPSFFQLNDGIIFTPKDASYAQTRVDKPHLKFKFSSKMSADFAIELIKDD